VKIEVHTVGALAENCYLVVDPTSNSAALVDPGAEGERLVRAVRESGATLTAIWLTHAHVDHVGGIAAVKLVWPEAPIHLNPLDAPIYSRAAQSAQMYGLLPFDSPPPFEEPLADGTRLTLGALAFDVLHTPGHAPGHSVLVGEGVMFAGDLLFAGSIGRTDLPFANPADMTRSLARVTHLPEQTVVYPGHGPSTTVGDERRSNPFLNGAARVRGG
jgi:glyoxylase-like metal-dependent hydrolase (beta-lactamase superfamily II)